MSAWRTVCARLSGPLRLGVVVSCGDISEAARCGAITVCFKKSNGYLLRAFQRRTSALRRDHVSSVRGEARGRQCDAAEATAARDV